MDIIGKKRKEDEISSGQEEPRPNHEDEMIPFCNPLGSSRSIPRVLLRPSTARIIKDITPSLTRAVTIRELKLISYVLFLSS